MKKTEIQIRKKANNGAKESKTVKFYKSFFFAEESFEE